LKLEFASAGDCHGETGKFVRFMNDCAAEPKLSLLVAAGDYQFNPTKDRPEAAKNVAEVFEVLAKWPSRVLVLGGNYEQPGLSAEVASRFGLSIFPIGSKPEPLGGRFPGNHFVHEGFHFLGVEGSNPINGRFPGERSEEELEWALSQAAREAGDIDPKRMVLVTHAPPYRSGSRDELGAFGLPITYKGKHVGSAALARFLVDRKPILHVCGHVHEGVGLTVYHWQRQQAENPRIEDVRTVGLERIVVFFAKRDDNKMSICCNHGTLEQWTYFRYRIAETDVCMAVEVSKQRLGGKDSLSRFIDRVRGRKAVSYSKIVDPDGLTAQSGI